MKAESKSKSQEQLRCLESGASLELGVCDFDFHAKRDGFLAKRDMKHAPFRGLSAILFKEFIIVLRDPMTLFFMLFPPLIEMIAFGYALDNDVKHMADGRPERGPHRREPAVPRSVR